MSNFDDIDKLIKPAVSWVRAQESLTGSRFKKAFPAKKQNFTATKYVSINPDYPQVGKIMKLLKNKDFAGAEAEAKGNELLLDAVAHYKNAMIGLIIDGRKLRGQIENMVPLPPSQAYIPPSPVASPTDEAEEVVWDEKKPKGIIFKEGHYVALDGNGNDNYIVNCDS